MSLLKEDRAPLYTIGHSTRKADDFIALLLRYGIRILVDVRTRPFSRFNPQFNRKALEALLDKHGIAYVFMGDTLGGRPDDPSCYVNGKIDYGLLSEKDFFLRGMEQLKEIYRKGKTVAIMCSEGKPSECHRTNLVAKALDPAEILVAHIDEKGKLTGKDAGELPFPD